MKRFCILVFLFAVAVPAAAFAQTQVHEGAIEDYIQIARSNVRTEKASLITKAMQFTDEESDKFWPIFRQYEAELGKLFDKRIQLIKEYSESYDSMTQPKARSLADRSLGLEKKRTKLKKKYYKKVEKVLSSKKAARFLQAENQLLLLIDLKIMSAIPLIK